VAINLAHVFQSRFSVPALDKDYIKQKPNANVFLIIAAAHDALIRQAGERGSCARR
jgi:hypothetical protein